MLRASEPKLLARYTLTTIFPLPVPSDGRHNRRMGSERNNSIKPDLFSTVSPREHSSLSPNSTAVTVKPSAPASRHVLPNDLPATRNLEDHELDQLHAAVTAEQQRRGKTPPAQEYKSNKPAPASAFSFSPSKINAVRAAFHAGINPATIASSFGVHQAEVRKVIAEIAGKLKP